MRLSVKEIAEVLGIARQVAARKLAGLPFEYQAARGGRRKLYLVADLPKPMRDKLLEQRVATVLSSPVAVGESAATVFPGRSSSLAGVLSSSELRQVQPNERRTEDLSNRERDNGKARVALLDQLYTWIDQIGTIKAVGQLVHASMQRALAPELQALVAVANAHGGKREGLSRASVLRWLAQDDRDATWGTRVLKLAAKPSKRISYELTDDVAAVLAKYRQPNKPSLSWCAKEVAKQLGVSWSALEHRARYFMKKVPRPVFYQGRNTGAALVALKPFQRRDFLSLKPNQVWIGDGHGAKLRVAHPITGSPFVPEVTVIMDVSDRYVVGWSVSLSENCIAVSDALRHAMSRHGVPLVYYSDNGGGQTNKMFDAPLTGTFGALGIYHATGRPHHPQARGVIERFWQTALISLARRFETFQGRGADRDTVRKVARDINKTLAAAKKANVAVLPRKLPSWAQFIEALEGALAEYNEAHEHRSLPKLDGARHATPAAYRASRLQETQIYKPQPDELAMLFMPAIVRRAKRGEIQLFNGIYYHRDLMLVDGEDVIACYDIHDPSYVLAKRPSGELIARATLGGNRGDYMPQPLIERLADQRAQRRTARLETQLAEVSAEHRGLVTPAPADIPEAQLIQLETELLTPRRELKVPGDPNERYAWFVKLSAAAERGVPVPAELQGFLASYPESSECRSAAKQFEEFGLDVDEYAADLVLDGEKGQAAALETRAA